MIGIIGAMDVEINFLKSKLENIKSLNIANRTFYKGILNNKEVVVVCAGIGKVNACLTTTLLLEKFDIEYVINIGVAGGKNPAKSLDLIISTELVYSDFDASIFGDVIYGQIPGYKPTFKASDELIEKAEKLALINDLSYKKGIITTGDKFITSLEQVNDIVKLYDCISFEMEGCAIAHTCSEFNKPFIVLRTVSDVLGEENQIDNYQNALKQAVLIVSKIVLGLI